MEHCCGGCGNDGIDLEKRGTQIRDTKEDFCASMETTDDEESHEEEVA